MMTKFMMTKVKSTEYKRPSYFKAKQFNWQLNKDTSCTNIIYLKYYFCLNFDTSP